MAQDVQDKINAIMQLVALEMEAHARREGKKVDPIAKLNRVREKILEAGLPLPDHLKK